MRLPLEIIIIIIIDELATDTHTLASCSLSHRSMTPICQKHLFRSIVISLYTYQSSHNNTLNEILCHRPEIGTFVRRLSISFDTDSRAFDVFPTILRLLPNVNDLDINDGYSRVSWTALPTNLCEALLTLLSPVIKSVSISISGFPISYVGYCTNLRSLIFTCYGEPSEFIFANTHAPPPSIRPFEALKIYGLSRMLTHLAPTQALSRLRSLECSIGCPEDVDAIHDAVTAAGPYLEELYISVSRGPYKQLNLSKLTALRSLKISRVMTHIHAIDFQWIGDTLETLSPSGAIRNVRLVLEGGFSEDIGDAAAMRRFDALLADERGGAVGRLELEWSYVRYHATHAKFLRRWMPESVKNNRLSVYVMAHLIFPEHTVESQDVVTSCTSRNQSEL